MDIIHSDKPEDRKRALAQAAFNPQIFKDLRERLPGGQVSEDALESYLKHENFLDRAISPVTKAYLETCRYLEQEKAFESGGNEPDKGGELASVEDQEAEVVDTTPVSRPPSAAPASAFMAPATVENDIKIMLDGDRLRVSAVVDLKGAKRLMKALTANIVLLEDDDDDLSDLA